MLALSSSSSPSSSMDRKSSNDDSSTTDVTFVAATTSTDIDMDSNSCASRPNSTFSESSLSSTSSTPYVIDDNVVVDCHSLASLEKLKTSYINSSHDDEHVETRHLKLDMMQNFLTSLSNNDTTSSVFDETSKRDFNTNNSGKQSK